MCGTFYAYILSRSLRVLALKHSNLLLNLSPRQRKDMEITSSILRSSRALAAVFIVAVMAMTGIAQADTVSDNAAAADYPTI